MASESKVTVLVAASANIFIGVAKAVAGALTGSSVMLAEAAHSLVDTTNEVLLLVAIRRGQRKPDTQHPFGYGKESYFWTLLAAVFMLVGGAGFSLATGIFALVRGAREMAPARYFVASYIVLAVALVAEGISLLRASSQLRAEADESKLGFVEYMRKGRNPTPKVVVFEDSAAVTGVVIAAAGLVLYQTTGIHYFDAIASILIGVLLASVAIAASVDIKSLLVGEGALPREEQRIRDVIEGQDGVACARDVMTMSVGPESLLVAARVHLDGDRNGADIEAISHAIDRRIREAVPAVRHVFVDPTSPTEPLDEQ